MTERWYWVSTQFLQLVLSLYASDRLISIESLIDMKSHGSLDVSPASTDVCWNYLSFLRNSSFSFLSSSRVGLLAFLGERRTSRGLEASGLERLFLPRILSSRISWLLLRCLCEAELCFGFVLRLRLVCSCELAGWRSRLRLLLSSSVAVLSCFGV